MNRAAKPGEKAGKKSRRKVDSHRLARYVSAMAAETMDVPDAIENLKDYEHVRMDAATEIRRFTQLLRELERFPSFPSAEALCRGSRRLRYAIREEPWDLAARPPGLLRHRETALELLKKAVSLRDRTLSAVERKDHAKVRRFFANIGKRKHNLARETA